MEFLFIILLFLCLGGSVVFYLLPAIIAFWNDECNKWWILLLNLLGGWTIIFWILAFAWSILEIDGSNLIKRLKKKKEIL